MNLHEYDTSAWWREEARISADDGRPDAAVAAMARALELDGREDAEEALARYRQAVDVHG